MNSRSRRPHRPAAVELQLRQEAGFGCCRCGSPIYEYHHIVPFHADDPYPPGEMMLLCPHCHSAATKGALPATQQWEHKRHPHNVEEGLAGGPLTVNQGYCAVAIGESLLVGDGTFVSVDDEPLLSLSLDSDGRLLLSVELFDETDGHLASVVANEWIAGDPFPWDIESDFQYLRLRRKQRDISLELDARHDPLRLRAELWRRGHKVSLRPDAIQIGERPADVSGIVNLGLVAMGLDLRTETGKVELRPDPRFEHGMLVSQESRIDRLVESVAAWHRLASKTSAIESPPGST